MKMNIDSNLIEQVKAGDEKAFTELFKSTYKYVYFLALKVCKNDDDAKEVAQLTLLQVKKSIVSLRDNKTFLGWLRRITMSKCYNLFDHNRDSIYDPMESKDFRNEQEKRKYMLPSQQARFQSDKEVIMKLIDELDEKYSTVLVLMYFEELTILEISELLEIPEGTVKSRLSKARTFLQNKVVKYENENDTRLNFQAFDHVLLISIFANCFVSMKVAIPTIGGVASIISFLSKAKNLIVTNSGNLIIAGTLAGVTTVGALASYQAYQNSQEQVLSDNQILPKESFKYNENEQPFPSVVVNNITYDKSKDAYFELLHWAHCEFDLEKKDYHEIETYEPLYHALKQANSVYYEELKVSAWATAFEDLSKK